MKLDLYTKGILTVIAFSLVVIAFKDTNPISNAFAHSGGNVVHKIAICSPNGSKCTGVGWNGSERRAEAGHANDAGRLDKILHR